MAPSLVHKLSYILGAFYEQRHARIVTIFDAQSSYHDGQRYPKEQHRLIRTGHEDSQPSKKVLGSPSQGILRLPSVTGTESVLV